MKEDLHFKFQRCGSVKPDAMNVPEVFYKWNDVVFNYFSREDQLCMQRLKTAVAALIFIFLSTYKPQI